MNKIHIGRVIIENNEESDFSGLFIINLCCEGEFSNLNITVKAKEQDKVGYQLFVAWLPIPVSTYIIKEKKTVEEQLSLSFIFGPGKTPTNDKLLEFPNIRFDID